MVFASFAGHLYVLDYSHAEKAFLQCDGQKFTTAKVYVVARRDPHLLQGRIGHCKHNPVDVGCLTTHGTAPYSPVALFLTGIFVDYLNLMELSCAG